MWMVTRDQQPCSAHRGIVAATFLAWMSFTKQGTAWDLSCIGIGFVGILGIVFSLGLFTSAVMGQPVWYWAGGTRTEQKTWVKLDRFGIAWRGSVRVPMVPWPCGPDCDPSLEPPCAATAVTTPHCVWVDGYLSACQSIPGTFQNINMSMVGDEWVPYFCVWSLQQRLASRVLSLVHTHISVKGHPYRIL